MTYITLVDVQAVLARPADTSSAFAVGSTSSQSHVGRVQVVVLILSETARRAYLTHSKRLIWNHLPEAITSVSTVDVIALTNSLTTESKCNAEVKGPQPYLIRVWRHG